MPFAYVIQNLSDGMAAKRPSWGGYVKKTVTETSTGAYTLTFKNRAGTEYVYTWNGTAWSAPSTPLSVDAEIMAAMAASDWIAGSVADFEAARSGSGVW